MFDFFLCFMVCLPCTVLVKLQNSACQAIFQVAGLCTWHSPATVTLGRTGLCAVANEFRNAVDVLLRQTHVCLVAWDLGWLFLPASPLNSALAAMPRSPALPRGPADSKTTTGRKHRWATPASGAAPFSLFMSHPVSDFEKVSSGWTFCFEPLQVTAWCDKCVTQQTHRIAQLQGGTETDGIGA